MVSSKPKIVVFTGAGISADSGLSTFRDNGLWDDHKVEDVCTLRTWKRNFDLVHQFYNQRRVQLGAALPNRAHRVVARWGALLPVSVFTQNVDDLHERGGIKEVVHVHGSLTSMHCTACGARFDIGYRNWGPGERCKCGSGKGVKPDVVFFGESAPNYSQMFRMFKALTRQDLLVVIGTSGQVINIGGIASQLPCTSVLSNLKSDPLLMTDDLFTHAVHGRASETIGRVDDMVAAWANGVGIPYEPDHSL